MGKIKTQEEIDSIVGTQFGYLKVLEYLGARRVKDQKRHFYSCLCECGKVVELNYNKLQTGNNTSCGCMISVRSRERMTTHGLGNSPEYTVWAGMKARCYNPKHKDYKSYGARGIGVSESWASDFENFYIDMGPRPSNKHTLERKDPYQDYSKENCFWTDDNSLQSFNTKIRKTNKSGRTGVSQLNSGRWTASICYKYKVYYLGSFDSYEEAVDAREKAEVEYFGFTKDE